MPSFTMELHDGDETFDLDIEFVGRPGTPDGWHEPGDPPEIEEMTISVVGYGRYGPGGVQLETLDPIDGCDLTAIGEAEADRRWKLIEAKHQEAIDEKAFAVLDDWDHDDGFDDGP